MGIYEGERFPLSQNVEQSLKNDEALEEAIRNRELRIGLIALAAFLFFTVIGGTIAEVITHSWKAFGWSVAVVGTLTFIVYRIKK